jgi:hypothetical protein
MALDSTVGNLPVTPPAYVPQASWPPEPDPVGERALVNARARVEAPPAVRARVL